MVDGIWHMLMTKRQRRIQYLSGHFRYYTMNTWNQSTSYARNVKLHKLTMDAETRARAYDLLDVPEAFKEGNALIADFNRKHDYQWQAGFNGRSGGYIVLYQGGTEEKGYKTGCDRCGRFTWYETQQKCHVEGCDGTLEVLAEDVPQPFVRPGKGTDEDEDFSEWSDADLEERVSIVREFDRLCDACIQSFITFAKTHTTEEREILVPKTVRVAVKLR
ncbi:MAG TPA: hypothetical protein VE422_30805 [Terriglobia bacterium]|nr:hypothetical protein [Terriglobia bacterium]